MNDGASSEIRPLALVTGASTGLGREIAIELARRGTDLLLVARGESDLLDVARRCREHDVDARVRAVDLVSPDGPERIAAWIDEHGGRLDMLINNAGIAGYGSFEGQTLELVTRIVDLNVRALTELTHRLIPRLVASRGRIMNVASVAGLQPSPLFLPYAPSKAYILMFSEALRHELRARGVTVTTLAPGSMRTPFVDKAGMQRSRAFTLMPAFPPERAAKIGVAGMLAGRGVVIPGVLNRLLARLLALLPRRLQAASVAFFLSEG